MKEGTYPISVPGPCSFIRETSLSVKGLGSFGSTRAVRTIVMSFSDHWI